MKRWMLALLLLLWACGAASAAARPETAESGWVRAEPTFPAPTIIIFMDAS